jgi:two-component system, NtrC family, response regulator GlrR
MPRILIVDDDAALLRLLELRLRAEGHDVVEATSGEAALARLDHELPELLITDLRMGGMDGLQLFEAVHRRHPLLPVLMLTAHGTIADAVKALQRGVFGYIAKPFEARDLMAEVERALAASQALGANMPIEGGDAGAGETWREAILTRSPGMRQLLAEAPWSRKPAPPSSSRATVAPARNCWPGRSTPPVRGHAKTSSR